MLYLDDDEYYKVPDFRQVDFFNSKNLDRNIIALQKSNNRINLINNNDNYVETQESGSSKLPYVDSQSIRSSDKVSPRRSSAGYSQRVSSPFLKLKNEEEKNMRFQYNKIFSKKYQQIVDDTPTEVKSKSNNYVRDKIEEMRSKIFFIKSVYDYSYPQIMVQKLKTMKRITNKIRDKAIEIETLNKLKTKQAQESEDRLFLRGRNYDYENEDILFKRQHSIKSKPKPAKFFKT